jgi:cobalt-zinc-cadmium efflux system outer membrane protein
LFNLKQTKRERIMKKDIKFRAIKPIMNRFYSLILISGMIWIFGQSTTWAFDGPTMLTEKDAINRGMKLSKVLKRQDATLQKAESEIIEALAWANPVFEYSQETSNDGPDDTVEKFFILSQELDLSGRRGLKTKATRKRFDVTIENNADWHQNRVADIRRLFYEALYQQKLLGAFEHWIANMDGIEEIMRKLKKGGEISGYDLLRLQRERALVIAEQHRTGGNYERSLQELRGMIDNESDDHPWNALTGSLLPEQKIQPLNDVLANFTNQPLLNALKLQGEALAFEKRAADRWWIPHITVDLGTKSIDTGTETGNGVFAKLSFPIPVLDRKAAKRQRTLAQKRLLESEYQLALGQRKGTASGLWQQAVLFEDAARRVGSGDFDNLINIAEASYQAGEIGILEILDAYRSAFEEKAQFLALAHDARRARIELNLITGGFIQ